MKMKHSKALLLDYLASVRDPERAASLFAEDGVFELPFPRSLGVEPRYAGRREITALVRKLLEIYPNFAFAASSSSAQRRSSFSSPRFAHRSTSRSPPCGLTTRAAMSTLDWPS